MLRHPFSQSRIQVTQQGHSAQHQQHCAPWPRLIPLRRWSRWPAAAPQRHLPRRFPPAVWRLGAHSSESPNSHSGKSEHREQARDFDPRAGIACLWEPLAGAISSSAISLGGRRAPCVLRALVRRSGRLHTLAVAHAAGIAQCLRTGRALAPLGRLLLAAIKAAALDFAATAVNPAVGAWPGRRLKGPGAGPGAGPQNGGARCAAIARAPTVAGVTNGLAPSTAPRAGGDRALRLYKNHFYVSRRITFIQTGRVAAGCTRAIPAQRNRKGVLLAAAPAAATQRDAWAAYQLSVARQVPNAGCV